MSVPAAQSDSRLLTQQPDPGARRLVISANPRAGARSAPARVEVIRRALVAAGHDVEVVTDLDELGRAAAALHRDGSLRAVLAAGGDGTATAVRNRTPSDVPMLPLPLGTESLLARYVHQTADPHDVCRTVGEGVVVRLDLGRAGERTFLLMLSAGFDAEVVRRMQTKRRGNITRAAYVKPTLATIRSYEYPEIRLYCPGDPANELLTCRWLFGFNLPCYACGLSFTPQATAVDGLLDVCTFQRGSLWRGLKYLSSVALGQHTKLADCQVTRGRSFRIEASDDQQVAYQVDGDIGGTLPIDVEIVPGGLTLLMPRQRARELGFFVPDEVGAVDPRSLGSPSTY